MLVISRKKLEFILTVVMERERPQQDKKLVSLEKQNSFVGINSCQFGYQNTSEEPNCARYYVIEAGLQFPVHIIKRTTDEPGVSINHLSHKGLYAYEQYMSSITTK